MTDRIAILDIGSNSVRYMKAHIQNGHVDSDCKVLCTTRLASGLDALGALSADRMIATAQAVAAFARDAKEQGFPVYAYATSATRDAANRQQFLDLIHTASGLSVTVLSGAEEGRLAFSGACQGGSMLDIGGGSLQVVTASASFSFPCGCVRAKDRIAFDAPQALQAVLTPWLDSVCALPASLPAPTVGVGGTITSLGALLAKQTKFDGASLAPITQPSLAALLDALYAMGLPALAAHPLLHKRHDVILHGGVLLAYLMERLHIETVLPCDRDGMEGFAEAVLCGAFA